MQGSGIMLKAYDFPVFLLSESSTSMLQEVIHLVKMSVHLTLLRISFKIQFAVYCDCMS